jgi:hypothetical protein
MSTNKLRYNEETRERIEMFLRSGGDRNIVPLSTTDENSLKRWRLADELLRSRMFRKGTIAKKIMAIFGVSRDTAYRDIVSTEEVFVSLSPHNKKYNIGIEIDFLQQKVREIDESMWQYDEKTHQRTKVFDADKHEAIAKYQGIIQKYYDKYPDSTPPRSPKTIIYNVQNNILAVDVTVEQANENFNKILKQLEDSDDY